ncbi:MAG TPA: DEAD/DEAH box helicase, partial [Pyrinomonadaceae bacterium]
MPPNIARLGSEGARKLALGLAELSRGKDINSVTVEDLLLYLPTRHEDRSRMLEIRDLRNEQEASLNLTVRIAKPRYIGRSRFIFSVSASDQNNTGPQVLIEWFISGQRAKQIVEFYTKRFVRGTRFIAFGKWQLDKLGTFCLKVQKPDELEVISSDEGDADPLLSAIHVGRCVPVYRKIGDIRPKQLRELLHRVLADLPDDAIKENLPGDLRERQKLIGRAVALRQIHFPPGEASLDEYERARSPAHHRLIFEELFWLSLALSVKRGHRTKESKATTIKIDDAIKRRIKSVLPFTLTEAQRKVVKEIFRDMKSAAPMNRLLQGDVGSGKTIVALISMLTAMENGYQTALMAPTEILAEQHARNIKRILAKSPYRVEVLTGSLKTGEKRQLHAAIAAGEVHCCVGTHALIQENVRFKNFGLAVIDEQHRFGVMQRAELRERGLNPDVLVMTATPIPRSLAMTVYGDLDVSIIDEMPPGRTPIVTKVFADNADDRKDVKRL